MPKSLSARSSLLVLLSLLTLLLLLIDSMGLYASTRVTTSLIYHGIMNAAMSAAIALLAVIRLTLRNKFLEPLDNMVKQLRRLVAGGLSLTTVLSVSAEFNHLSAAMDDMRHTLGDLVQRVHDANSQVDIGSREPAAGNQHLVQHTEPTVTSLEQTVASVGELTTTIKQNAQNTEQAHQLIRSVSDTADRGSEMVCYVIERMRDVPGSPSRIANILGVIDDIAFQTDILTLNASAEAARAGEQGRGFVAVVDEVHNLASRSAEAAKEIRTLISDSHTYVGGDSEPVQRAGEAMNEIATEAMCMAKLMCEIAGVSQGQGRGIEQVNIAIIQIDETAQQNAALVRQFSATTRSLEEQSSALIGAMTVFKLQKVQAGGGFYGPDGNATRFIRSTSVR